MRIGRSLAAAALRRTMNVARPANVPCHRDRWWWRCPDLPARRRPVRQARGAFTLFEILVVLAILSIVATIGVPAVLQSAKKSPLRQAVSDLTEGCQNARMMAILQGERTELVIKGTGTDRTIEVRLAPETAAAPLEAGAGGRPTEDGSTEAPGEPRLTSELKSFQSKLPEGIEFLKLTVNLQDMGDAPEARVRFYPNGTCDAFLAILLSEQGEKRKITLEVTTGRESIDIVR